MGIIWVALAAVLLGDCGHPTKINEFAVSIRHAKKKDHNYREDRHETRTFALEEANDVYEQEQQQQQQRWWWSSPTSWSSDWSSDSTSSAEPMYADDSSTSDDWTSTSADGADEQRDEWPADDASTAGEEPPVVGPGPGTEGPPLDELAVDAAKEDVVTKFLRIVESQQELGANCTAGTDLNLGEGVVDRYAQVRR